MANWQKWCVLCAECDADNFIPRPKVEKFFSVTVSKSYFQSSNALLKKYNKKIETFSCPDCLCEYVRNVMNLFNKYNILMRDAKKPKSCLKKYWCQANANKKT